MRVDRDHPKRFIFKNIHRALGIGIFVAASKPVNYIWEFILEMVNLKDSLKL